MSADNTQTGPVPELTGAAGSASVIVAEGYYRIKAEHERLKELCAVVEPWAAHNACNAGARGGLSYEVYQACLEMRRIVWPPNSASTDK